MKTVVLPREYKVDLTGFAKDIGKGMNWRIKKIFSPLSLPILFFLSAILLGTILLHSSFSTSGKTISWLDAFFTATSATCVTGLTTIDTGLGFSKIGQAIILILIQVGGLGIMSFTSLAFYLFKSKVSLTDRVAVGQSLLHDSSFDLGKFLVRLFVFTFSIELAGAFILYVASPPEISVFSSVFHSISAFCNAGFSLNPDSMIRFRGNWPINLTLIILIILGGLGFFVLIEGKSYLLSRLKERNIKKKNSWYFSIVVRTSIFLIIVGWVYFYLSEFMSYKHYLPLDEALLSSLFQSVTCRTAGFNTLDISSMTNASLVFMIFLMFIGGAPGSCAGGIKVTTFRVLWAFITAQLRGREQASIGEFAVDRETINRSLTLLFFSLLFILVSVLLLDFSEGGDLPHSQVRGHFLEILFEAVSAFGTVGLSTGLTPKLSPFGKIIIIALMFVGRLGPLILLSALQSIRTQVHYTLPEEKLSIG